MTKSVKIGNSSGFWGDNPYALKQQLEGGDLDYITADYLAELTMSILYKQQVKSPNLGYIPDFIEHLSFCVNSFVNKNTKIITNAGGNNPKALAKKIFDLFKKSNKYVKIAFIEGDNLINLIANNSFDNAEFETIENEKPFIEVERFIKCANAYTGFPSIVEALNAGAEIVICGRASDSAITIAPIVYELGWEYTAYDKLGSAMIAAHIIECGTQATGGNFTDWKSVENWEKLGFPNIEVYEDGSFDVYKHQGTGGIISINTVKEQLVYEIENPKYYYSPDVIADLTSIKVSQKDEGIVHVSAGKGIVPTPYYKVSMAYDKGYKASGTILFSGPDALLKAKCFEEIITVRFGIDFKKTNIEYIGCNSTHLSLVESKQTNEILLRAHVFDLDKRKIDDFRKQFTGLILSGPPGVTSFGGRPKRKEVVAYSPFLVKKSLIPLVISYLNEYKEAIHYKSVTDYRGEDIKQEIPKEVSKDGVKGILTEYNGKRLIDICLARSGDKGNSVNIGVIARTNDDYYFLRQYLTSCKVKSIFSSHCDGTVSRYELPNLKGFNFFLRESLDGGGTVSMRADNQGKTFAQALLNHIIEE